MMIEYTKGNIFEAEVDTLVNPVNCVGVMGKGLALQFKKKFPENFVIYKDYCDRGEMEIGKVLWVYGREGSIIHFPTKIHWKNPSNIKFISWGLHDLARILNEHTEDIKSIAIPPLGCGLGGLKWEDVKPFIGYYLGNVEQKVLVYEP